MSGRSPGPYHRPQAQSSSSRGRGLEAYAEGECGGTRPRRAGLIGAMAIHTLITRGGPPSPTLPPCRSAGLTTKDLHRSCRKTPCAALFGRVERMRGSTAITTAVSCASRASSSIRSGIGQAQAAQLCQGVSSLQAHNRRRGRVHKPDRLFSKNTTEAKSQHFFGRWPFKPTAVRG
jgi:hypothetical protein